MKRCYAVLYVAISFFSLAAVNHTSKTYFKSQELRPINYHAFFDRAPETHLVENDLVRDFRLDTNLIYRISFGKEKLGAYFGIDNQKNTVTVGANDTKYDIFNQKIIYYDPNTEAAPEARATFTLLPRESVQAAVFSARKWLKDFFIDATLTVARVEHSWLDPLSSEAGVGVLDPAIAFFQGNVYKLKQNALTNGLISNPIPTRGYQLTALTLLMGVDTEIKQETRVGFFGQIHFPVGSVLYDTHLFYPVLGNIDHVGVGLGIRGLVPFVIGSTYLIGCSALAKIDHYFKHDEQRLMGIKYVTPVGNASQPWGHYFLTKRSTDTAYSAGADILGPQKISVSPGLETTLVLNIFAEGSLGAVNMGYRCWLRGDEDVALRTPATADAYTEILTSTSYKILPDITTATVPSAVTHGVHGEFIYFVPKISGAVHASAGYEWSLGNAALDNMHLSIGFHLSF